MLILEDPFIRILYPSWEISVNPYETEALTYSKLYETRRFSASFTGARQVIPIFSWISPFPRIDSYFCKIHPNISLQCMPRPFFKYISYRFASRTITPSFFFLTNKFLIKSLLQSLLKLILRPYIGLRILFSNILIPCSSLSVSEHVS